VTIDAKASVTLKGLIVQKGKKNDYVKIFSVSYSNSLSGPWVDTDVVGTSYKYYENLFSSSDEPKEQKRILFTNKPTGRFFRIYIIKYSGKP
jgi:hypothetical protein